MLLGFISIVMLIVNNLDSISKRARRRNITRKTTITVILYSVVFRAMRRQPDFSSLSLGTQSTPDACSIVNSTSWHNSGVLT